MEQKLFEAAKSLVSKREGFYEKHQISEEDANKILADTEYCEAWERLEAVVSEYEASLINNA